MSRIVTGVFKSYDDAESAAKQVKLEGLKTEDISILTHQGEGKNANGGEWNDIGDGGGNTLTNGIVEGGVLGSAAGLLLGMGTVAVPGLGIIAAAGPVAGLLTGAVTGGIVGSLLDIGIPSEYGREYEIELKRGNVVWSMKTSKDKASDVARILRDYGAERVEIY